jgi:hypothetical protein
MCRSWWRMGSLSRFANKKQDNLLRASFEKSPLKRDKEWLKRLYTRLVQIYIRIRTRLIHKKKSELVWYLEVHPKGIISLLARSGLVILCNKDLKSESMFKYEYGFSNFIMKFWILQSILNESLNGVYQAYSLLASSYVYHWDLKNSCVPSTHTNYSLPNNAVETTESK